jgi:hypothetical protein
MNNERHALFQELMTSYGYGTSFVHPVDKSTHSKGLEEVRSIFHYNMANQKRALGPKGIVYFDFLNNQNFNALAAVSNENEFVTIFIGSIQKLYNFFYVFMSDPEVLPFVGNTSNEKPLQNIWDILELNPPGQFLFPKDRERVLCAQNLALISCLMILNHEMGHIANCHVSFIKEYLNIEFYEEIQKREKDQVNFIRALEWEADEYAGIVTYQFIRHFEKFLNSSKAVSIDTLISISIFSLHLYTNKILNSNFVTEFDSHPAPMDRWLWTMLSIESSDACIALNPSNENLLKGVSEVANFWKRNKLLKNQEIREEDFSAAKTNERFNSTKKEFKFMSEKLERLVAERNHLGSIWRNLNNEEFISFGKSALLKLQQGPVYYW